jgi:hypothetical protein
MLKLCLHREHWMLERLREHAGSGAASGVGARSQR